jgi:hypothetical protein
LSPDALAVVAAILAGKAAEFGGVADSLTALARKAAELAQSKRGE